jgi:hypothetical protein
MLSAALAGLAGWAAGAIGRPSRALAVDGQPILQGVDNAGTQSTVVRVSAATAALQGVSDASSGTPYGVRGRVTHTDGAGVLGVSTAGFGTAPGVLGVTNSDSHGAAGVRGKSADGVGNDGTGNGVWGSSPGGAGVRGTGTQTGVGVLGESAQGIGIRGHTNADDRPAIAGFSDTFTAIMGVSRGGNIPTAKPKTGVYGLADHDGGSHGVWGESPAGRAVQGTSPSGYAGYFQGKVYTTKWYELGEIAAPATPGTTRARLFLRDNGGRTQLCVKFGNGQVKVLASET